jgi:Flp pilus assembly protein TadG
MMRAQGAVLSEAIVALACCRRGNVLILFALALIPLLGFCGVAIDYTRALALSARLQSASDAAALAVSEAAGANANESERALRAVAQNYLTATLGSARPSITDFHVCTAQINDCSDKGSTMRNGTVALSVSATLPRTLSRFAMAMMGAGHNTMSVSSRSVATITSPLTIVLNLVFDTSASMIVGATAADVTKISNWVMQNWNLVKPGDPPPSYPTGDNPPCAFACHDVGSATQPGDVQLGLTRARSAGATTRWDVMLQAAQQLVSHVESETQGDPRLQRNSYLFNVLSIDDALHSWGASNMGFSAATAAIQSMTPGLDTHLVDTMPALINQIGTQGTGQSTGSPLKFAILITDGLQSDRSNNWSCNSWGFDSYWNYSSTCYGGYATTIEASQCAQIKNAGIVLGVLETPYVPLTGQSPNVAPYEKTVRHVIYPDGPSAPSSASAALQDCATSGYYFQATSSSQIATGFITLADKFLYSTPYLAH